MGWGFFSIMAGIKGEGWREDRTLGLLVRLAELVWLYEYNLLSASLCSFAFPCSFSHGLLRAPCTSVITWSSPFVLDLPLLVRRDRSCEVSQTMETISRLVIPSLTSCMTSPSIIP